MKLVQKESYLKEFEILKNIKDELKSLIRKSVSGIEVTSAIPNFLNNIVHTGLGIKGSIHGRL